MTRGLRARNRAMWAGLTGAILLLLVTPALIPLSSDRPSGLRAAREPSSPAAGSALLSRGNEKVPFGGWGDVAFYGGVTPASGDFARAPAGPGVINTTLSLVTNSLTNGNVVPPNGLDPSSVITDSITGNVYITETDSQNVTILNGTTDAVLGEVAVESGPDALAFDGTNGHVFVASKFSDSVTVLNGSTNQVLAITTTGQSPGAMVYDNANGDLYVVNSNSSNVSILRGTTGAFVGALAVGADPSAIALDGLNNHLFVSNVDSNNVTVINGSTNTVLTSISVEGADGATFDRYTGFVYLSTPGAVTLINGSSNLVAGSIPVGVAYANPSGIAFDSANAYLYVADSGSNAVSVIDGASGSVVTTVPVGNGPEGITVDLARGTVYVTDALSDRVTEIQSSTETVTATISVGARPIAAAFDPASGRLFVADYDANTLWSIAPTSGTVQEALPVGFSPAGVAVDAANGDVYVTNSATAGPQPGAGNVTVLNGTSGQSVGSIQVGPYPSGIAVNPTNGYVYVANSALGNLTPHAPHPASNVTIIDGADDRTVGSVGVGILPTGVAYDSQNGDVYVTNALSGNVTVFNGSTGDVVAWIGVGFLPEGIAFDHQNGYVYVANRDSSNVSVINGTSQRVVETLPVGLGPSAVTVDDVNGYVYVANSFSDNVTVIGGYTDRALGSLLVGTGPTAIAFDSANDCLYVSNSISGSVSMILPLMSTFPATFRETGLPVGKLWSVSTGSTLNGSVTNTIGFLERNTTGIEYTIDPVAGYSSNPTSGTLIIDAQAVNESVAFTLIPTYPVWFNETGLPARTDWQINLSFTGESPGAGTRSATVASIEFAEPAGFSGTYTVGLVPGYTPLSAGGTVQLPQPPGPATIVIAFLPTGEFTTSPPSITEFDSDPETVDTGANVVFSTVVSGGASPLSFTYTGLPVGCPSENSSMLNCTPTIAETLTVMVHVSDRYGRAASANVTLTVTAANRGNGGGSEGSTFGLPSFEAYVVIGTVLAVLIAVAAWLKLQKRRAIPPSASFPPDDAEPPMGERPE